MLNIEAVFFYLQQHVVIVNSQNLILFLNLFLPLLLDVFVFVLRSRLAKSTLTLIPLLGIHAILFTFVIDESVQKGSLLRTVRLFYDLLFNSFQVRAQAQFSLKLN